jgi:hypothetical protein
LEPKIELRQNQRIEQDELAMCPMRTAWTPRLRILDHTPAQLLATGRALASEAILTRAGLRKSNFYAAELLNRLPFKKAAEFFGEAEEFRC